MEVGVPREVKIHERRVGMVPTSVRELVHRGHTVYVQTGAGSGIGISDAEYEGAGAQILPTAEDVFAKSRMIVKVKEPQSTEWALLNRDHILFTYLHLAADRQQTIGLMESGCAAIAYETITDDNGRLPLLAPMSEVAGRMSVQVGAHALENTHGGSGTLLGGVPGILPGRVVVIGAGMAGKSATRVALGVGARVTVLDADVDRLRYIEDVYGGQGVTVLCSNAQNIERSVLDADLVIGSVLIPGGAAPKLVGEDLVKEMKKGSVLVDIAIDQGGCFETSRPTTHSDPLFVKHGVVHYCVTNMPGAVARTSTFALSAVTSPFIANLADEGLMALEKDRNFLNGLNVCRGSVTFEKVAQALDLPYVDPRTLLG